MIKRVIGLIHWTSGLNMCDAIAHCTFKGLDCYWNHKQCSTLVTSMLFTCHCDNFLFLFEDMMNGIANERKMRLRNYEWINRKQFRERVH